MPRNVSYSMNEKYDFVGWVELYNETEEPLLLSDFIFSDGKISWRCEMDSSIMSHGYVVFYFDGLNEGVHTSFKLDANGGELFVYDTLGTLVDEISYPETFRNTSYGVLMEGSREYAHLSYPTLGESNIGTVAIEEQASVPYSSLPGGFYEGPQSLILAAYSPTAKIYYTTDGTEPFEADSLLYTDTIRIEKTLPIRAICADSGKYSSVPMTMTYFIDERNMNLPVVSIVTDSRYLFDDTLGIYVVGIGRNASTSASCGDSANYWGNESRPINLEVFFDKKQVVSQEVKTKNFGACSRVYDKKSMKINAGKSIGESEINYPLFKEKPNIKIKGIVLRNDGNDLTFKNSILIRDGLIQSLLIGRMDIDHLSFQPSVVFINGEYYGVLNIREKSDEDYIYSNYALKEEYIDYDDYIKKPTNKSYLSLRDTLSRIDCSLDSSYDVIESLIDVEEWLNYFMVETYVGNLDWPLNNSKVWKRKENGKWRYILFDLDYGYWGSGSCTVDVDNIRYAEKNPEFANIIQNPQIFNKYISKFIAHVGTTFSLPRVTSVMDSLMNLYENELIYYWVNELNRKEEKWENNKGRFLSFAKERPSYIFTYLRDYYSLGDTAQIQIYSEKGTEFVLNDERIDTNDFTSKCFDGFNLTLKCCPPDGYQFDHWEIFGAEAMYTCDSLILNTTFNGQTSYHAVLKKDTLYDESKPLLFINEVCITNKQYVDEERESDDWIEIYNAGSSPVDIAGMYISDGKNMEKCQIPFGYPALTTIPGRGFLVIWADGQEEQGPLHANFSLSASKRETVSLSSYVGESLVVIDSVSYELHEKGESYARFSFEPNSWEKTCLPSFLASNKHLSCYENEEIERSEENDFVEEDLVMSTQLMLSFYPNPVSDILNVSLPWDDPTRLIIYNGGSIVLSKMLQYEDAITVSSLEMGLYIVVVVNLNTGEICSAKVEKR